MTDHTLLEGLDHPHLRRLASEADDIAREVEGIRTQYSASQMAWKPRPDVWNMLECIDHLTKTGEVYYDRMRDALARADRTDPTSPYKPHLFAKFFIRMVSPTSKRKLKTFRVFEPTPALTDVAALDRFLEQQNTLRDMIRAADGVNVNSGTFSSPVTRLIRFTVGEALTMIVTHQQRHLLQAKDLTQRVEFPDQ